MTFKGHSKSPTVSPFDKSSPNLYLFPIVKTYADLLPFLRYNKNREFFILLERDLFKFMRDLYITEIYGDVG